MLFALLLFACSLGGLLMAILYIAGLPLFLSMFFGVVLALGFWIYCYIISKEPDERNARLKEPKQKQPKEAKPSVSQKLAAKLHLSKIRKKWQKSSHSRHIPAMRRHFKRWARVNPEIKPTISVVLGQMDQLAMMTNIFDTILKTSEYGHKGEDCRQAYDFTVSQMRQNFSDIYNLMILAGANQGKATMETLDQIALAKELNSNRIKLELLGELNVEVTRYINQTDGPYDNAMLEAEIETLSRMNAVRQSKVPNEMAPSTASGTTSGATAAQTTPKTS